MTWTQLTELSFGTKNQTTHLLLAGIRSGQKVNYHKSAFQLTTKVPNSKKMLIQGILSISNNISLDKYLGCPIINKRVNSNTFSEIVTKTKQQLTKWKANSLSQAGRATLIRTNLSAKPNFIMQSFMVHNSNHHDLDTINRTFFWNKEPNYSPLIGWDKICQPVNKGGLGIRKTKDINCALQYKLLWKILAEPENCWVKVITGKYLKQTGILDYTRDRQKSSSWQWRNMTDLLNEFKKGLMWRVGNGENIRFWKDPWILEKPIEQITEISRLTNPDMKVSEVIKDDKTWDIAKLREYVPSNILEAIKAVPLTYNNFHDRLYWAMNKNGWFTTKSAMDLIIKNKRYTGYDSSWIWKLDTYPKIKNFLWKIVRNGLPTKDRLIQKRVPVSADCMACNAAHEDSFHILFQCQKTINLLTSINMDTCRFIRSNVGNYVNTRDFIDTIHRTMKKHQFIELITTWWSIWYSRNQQAFGTNQNDQSVTHDLKGYIGSQIREWEKTKKWTNDLEIDTMTSSPVKTKQTT